MGSVQTKTGSLIPTVTIIQCGNASSGARFAHGNIIKALMHNERESVQYLPRSMKLCIVVLAVLLGGCALFQPCRNVIAYPPASEPQWQDLNSAARICRINLENPPLNIHAVKVDLQNEHVRCVVYPSAPSEYGAGTSLSKKVSTFARESQCFVAVNANPFAPSSGNEGELRTIT